MEDKITKNLELEKAIESEKTEFQPYDLNIDKNLSEIILTSNYEIIDYNNSICLITLLGTYIPTEINNTNKSNEKEKEKKEFILRIKKKEFEILNEIKSNDNDINNDNKLNSKSQKYNNLLSTLINEIENYSNVVFKNDIYYKFISKASDNSLKIDFIFPADKKVIEKYRKKFFILFEENYETYLTKTLNYINSIIAYI